MRLLSSSFVFLGLALALSGCDNSQTNAVDPHHHQAALKSSIPQQQAQTYGVEQVVNMSVVPASSNLQDPAAQAWANTKEYQVELATAPPVHPSISLRHDSLAPSIPVIFSVATDHNNVYIRVRWQDKSLNRYHSFDQFADAAAIQFALNGGVQTSFMMGSVNAPVNMWYWNAAKPEPQNLLASGFGTVTDIAGDSLSANAAYLHANSDDGSEASWMLVFSRPIATESNTAYQVDLENSQLIHFSLGIWQGEDKQRDGLKRIYPGWISAGTQQVAAH
ncbi:hypothetical protein R50073_15700 [Maricurvus nonylphenolicus]|uniref:ethylbenzene dehydrogenase-related protein n=1 Tax=Maricurvus nonylphenolicus TaxID=1008307 RepID=UPI0036F34758